MICKGKRVWDQAKARIGTGYRLALLRKNGELNFWRFYRRFFPPCIPQCKMGMERPKTAGVGIRGSCVFQKMERDGGHVGTGGWAISAEDVFGKNCENLPPRAGKGKVWYLRNNRQGRRGLSLSLSLSLNIILYFFFF